MTKQFFENLQLPAQLQILFEEGKVVSDRNDKEHRVTLYNLADFLVEVFCDLNFTTIEDIKLMKNPDQLRMYDLGTHIQVKHLLA